MSTICVTDYFLSLILLFGILSRGMWDVWSQSAALALTSFLFAYSVLKSSRAYFNCLSKFFILLILYLIVNTTFSKNKLTSFYELLNYINYFLVYFIAVGIDDKENFKKHFSYAGIFLASLFLIQKLMSPSGGTQGTLWGTLPKQNIFALIIVFSFFLIIENGFNSWSSPPIEMGGYTVKNVLKALLLLFSLMLSSTVSVSLGLIAGIAYIVSKKIPGVRKKRIAFSILILLVVLVLIKKISEPNVIDRYFWWLASFKIFLDYPIFGVGLGNFDRYVSQYNFSGFHSIYAHCYYLQILAETGVVGFVIFFFLVYLALKELKNVYIKAAVIAILVSAITDYTLNMPIISLIFWCFCGAGNYKSNHRWTQVNTNKAYHRNTEEYSKSSAATLQKHRKNPIQRFSASVANVFYPCKVVVTNVVRWCLCICVRKIFLLFMVVGLIFAAYLKFNVSKIYETAKFLAHSGRYSESLAEIEKLPVFFRETPPVYEMEITSFLYLKNHSRAYEVAKKLLNTDKNSARNWYYLYLASKEIGDYAMSKKALEQASRIAPYSKFYRDEIVRSHKKSVTDKPIKHHP